MQTNQSQQHIYDNQLLFYRSYIPGGIELMRKWNKENIVNDKEDDKVFRAAGISRELV
jgi:hypothetical protein